LDRDRTANVGSIRRSHRFHVDPANPTRGSDPAARQAAEHDVGWALATARSCSSSSATTAVNVVHQFEFQSRSFLRAGPCGRPDNSADHAAEIARLQRENERLRMERDL
jgi:hypothetical protein